MKVKLYQKLCHFIYLYITLFFICILFLMTSCISERIDKVTKVSDVIWFSTNPKLEILILKESVGGGFGYIYDNNIKTDLYFKWGFSQFSFCLAEKYKIAAPTSDKYISGQYTTISNSEVNLFIDGGNLFDGKYLNQTLTLKSKPVNRNDLDIIFLTNVQWKSASPALSFNILYERRRRGKGEIEYGNKLHNIIFYWEETSKFSVYELKNEIQSESPILSGTYVSENLKATLTIEEDAIFNHEFDTIQLIAKGLNDP